MNQLRPVLTILALFHSVLLGYGQPAFSPVPATRVLQDIQYVAGPGFDPRFHSLDLYLPEGRSNLPLMFFVHGGGWRGGEKSQEGRVRFINLLLSQGMAVASIDHRVSPAVKHPAHIQDVARAFAWVYKNATEVAGPTPELETAGRRR